MRAGTTDTKMKNKLLVILTVVLFIVGISAFRVRGQQQSASAVQQVATRTDAASICLTSAASAGTITWTPPGGQFVYVTEIDFQRGENTTGIGSAAAPTTVSISNIQGSPIWDMASGPVTTPGINVETFTVSYPMGLKSAAPGTAVTITLPTIPANTFTRVNACAYYGY